MTPEDPEDWPDIEPVEESFEEAVGLLLGLADPAPSPFEDAE